MSQNTPVIVTSLTHWDRAWYQPFQQLRSRLVHVVDELLEILKRDDYRVFHLDGQTVVLEDYLAIRPEKAPEIARLVQGGRLRIGPWYVLADEFLAGGECLIRNLLIGAKIAQAFGPVLPVGYTPDSFGHVSQMPQILNGFGIGSFLFLRGLSTKAARSMGQVFRWIGADGRSEVDAFWLPYGYGSAPFTVEPVEGKRVPIEWRTIKQRLLADLAALEKHKHVGVLLMCNGNDHAFAESRLGAVLERANDQIEGYRFEHAGLERYAQLVAERKGRLQTYRGQMRDGGSHGILSGTQSSRMYLKQANIDCQNALLALAEPMAVLASLAGFPYPQAELDHAWKKLLKNQPHDDICGCSVDGTHRDMDTRFRNCLELADQLTARSLYVIAHSVTLPRKPGPRVIAGHGLQTAAKYRLRNTFDLPDPTPRNVVLDSRGRALPTLPGEVQDQIETDWDPRVGTFRKRTKWKQEIEWLGALPPCGYEQFVADVGSPVKTDLRARGNTVENNLVKVSMRPDGSVTILDKKSRLACEGNIFEDNEDEGDGYDYSRLPVSPPAMRSAGLRGKVSVSEAGPVEASVRCEMTMRVPASLTPDRKARSARSAALKILTTATLRPGDRMVRFHTEVQNTAKDHRLRVLFGSGVRKARAVDVEGAFDVLGQAVDLPPAREVADWGQKPIATKFQGPFVSVSDGRRGLTVINRGLPEYEARRDRGGVSLLVTLFRCFGKLSTMDHFERGSAAGPELPTPDAQCQGLQSMDYAVVLHRGDWERSKVWQDAHAFNGPSALMLTMNERPLGHLPSCGSLLTVDNPAAVISGIKASEDCLAIVVRLWNISTRPIAPALSSMFRIVSAAMANMKEEPQKELVHTAHGLKLPRMRPKEIVTLRIEAAALAPRLRSEDIAWPTGVSGYRTY